MKKMFLQFTLALALAGGPSLLAEEGKPCCKKPAEDVAAATALSDASIYQVESTWTNDTGKAVALSSLRGKPQVITMFFAKCEYACPILAHDMKRIESALPESVRSQIGFTLVTFDTERDTVEELASFRQKQGLNENWILLRGSSSDVLELAALLGIKFKKDARGQFAHSNVILVLNAEGEIVHQLVGLNQPIEKTVEVIENLHTNGKKVSARSSRQSPL